MVAEAGTADEAVRVARELHPRIVLLDVSMPGTPSLDTIPDLLAATPGCDVVVLTMHDDYAREALGAGAVGYVLKDAAERQLVDAIRAILGGSSYLDPGLGARLLATPPARPRPGARLRRAGDRVDVRRPSRRRRRRPRRHGRRLPGDRPRARPAGRPEADLARARVGPGLPRPLRVGVPPGGGDRPPARGRGVPRGRGAGAAVRDHALRRRDGPAGDPPRRGPARPGARRARRRRRRGRARRGAPPRARAPGRQAGERARHRARRRRAGVPERLRADEGAGGPERADRHGPGDRHGRLHRARAGAGRGAGRPRRRVRARLRPLPGPHGRGALRARQRRGEDVGAHPPAAARAAGRPAGPPARARRRARARDGQGPRRSSLDRRASSRATRSPP